MKIAEIDWPLFGRLYINNKTRQSENFGSPAGFLRTMR